METNRLTELQLKDAFCEVRKAHRLIYEYQHRMQDLTWFIKNKLGFPKYEGYKKFSNPLGDGKKIYVDNWSWDWIYTYMYEYYLGECTTDNNDYSWRMSIIQISDTGFYQNKDAGAKPTKINSFASADDSESKILFHLSVAPKKLKDYDCDINVIIEKYANENTFVKINERPEHIQIVYSVALSKFIDEESTMRILRCFVDYCNKEAGTCLEIQE